EPRAGAGGGQEFCPAEGGKPHLVPQVQSAHGCCLASAQQKRSHLPILPRFQSRNYPCTPAQGKTSEIRVQNRPIYPQAHRLSPEPSCSGSFTCVSSSCQFHLSGLLCSSSKIHLLPSDMQQFPQAGSASVGSRVTSKIALMVKYPRMCSRLRGGNGKWDFYIP
uniref:Uncharacterized protein n=1 Tax=Buteo japonicus TaxID=224669 RepID=A0A8C0BIH0_9AVES